MGGRTKKIEKIREVRKLEKCSHQRIVTENKQTNTQTNQKNPQRYKQKDKKPKPPKGKSVGY